MSIRPKVSTATAPTTTAYGTHFSAQPAVAAMPAYDPTAPAPMADHMQVDASPPLSFDDLTPTEQAAASLGVQPDSLKPISWLNDAHYENLKSNNALEPNLVRRIEAYKHVSKSSSDAAAMTAPPL